MELITEEKLTPWREMLLDESTGAVVKDFSKQTTIARMLDQQSEWNAKNMHMLAAKSGMLNETALPTNATGANIATWDPVLITMLRRAAPQLIAYDVCGVQPMSMPTGQVFSIKARYGTDNSLTNNVEALFNEADTDYSGTGTHAGSDPSVLNDASPGTYTRGTGMATATAEGLDTTDGSFKEMGFSIEKFSVTAKTRALFAGFTNELVQDLRAVHGLDAKAELTNILSQEILFATNREILGSIYKSAKIGAQDGTTTAGTFDLDTDSNGRWSVEKFKGLMFQLEREANKIQKETRRGKGNFAVVTHDVASALALAGKLDFAPALEANLNVDTAMSTFVGMFGQMKIFVDPYITSSAGAEFACIGFKGDNNFDAGAYYSPYVPLELYEAIDPKNFQPSIAFKTRYALSQNPFATDDATDGALGSDDNKYYRKLKITNLM